MNVGKSFRYGRWKVLVPTGVLQMVFSVGCAFIQNYYLYIVVRFLIAVNVGGAFMTGFVLGKSLLDIRIKSLEFVKSISFVIIL